MSKTTLILRIVGTVSHLCSNQMPSNLLFHFSSSCIGHLNKTQMEMAVMLTFPVFENYTEKKTMLKVSRMLVNPPQNGSPLNFF